MGKLILKENDKQGMLITFCGLDGSGKTSMITLLKEKFERMGIDYCLTKQPTKEVRTSAIFRTYMDAENHDEYDYRALSLMAASDRIQHTNKVIVPWLEEGKNVISDRYFYSCLANLRARGYTKDQWIYEIAKDIIKPTISIFMDVPVEEAVRRVRQRPEERERYIDMELQYRLREEYLNIANDVGGLVISSQLSQEQCFQMVLDEVEEKMKISMKEPSKEVCETIYQLLKQYTISGDDMKDDMRLEDDLGMDSLKRAQFICDIEETLDFEFCVQDLAPNKFFRVGDICRLVMEYVRQG